MHQGTVCLRSSDPIYIVTYYIKCGKTTWTESTFTCDEANPLGTVCPRSLDPIYILYSNLLYNTGQDFLEKRKGWILRRRETDRRDRETEGIQSKIVPKKYKVRYKVR